MLKKSLISILLLITYLGSCLLIYNLENNSNKKHIKTVNIKSNQYINNKVNNQLNDKIIGTLKIDKLNLSNNIYNIDSPNNNVDENVTILKDDINLIVLAAHSGPGYIAYFDNLDQLKINDIIKPVREWDYGI